MGKESKGHSMTLGSGVADSTISKKYLFNNQLIA
jgi:hypothetical protein